MTSIWMVFIIVLTGLALAGIVVAVMRYLRAIHSARERLANLNSHIIETECGPIEYACVGEGYPVLVVHGAFCGFDQGLWAANSGDFSQYRVISVSRFGYLGTPLPAGANLNLQADAFAALLDVQGIQQAVVLGVSAGSTSSIRFAARHPERVSALILFGPDAPGENYMTMPPRFFLDKILRSDFIFWILISLFPKKVRDAAGLVPKGNLLTPEQETFIKKAILGSLPISHRIDGEIFESYDLLPDFYNSVLPTSPYPLNRIKTPVLVINAADDPISLPKNVRALAEKLPNVRLFLVPDGGHFIFGHTEEVKVEIERFLNLYIGKSHQRS